MTEIKLYNTRTRAKETFVPMDWPDDSISASDKRVRMYVCGPTVYDRAHIGNARPVVVFDVLYRLLRHVYGADHVTYARNFTDVDDRIIERAVQTKGAGETLEAATRRITDETIRWYHEDMDALGALRPDHEPRCTEFIEPMVRMTEELIAKGHAYEAEGHVLFAVETYDRYGALAGRSLDDMIAGARVEVAPYKKNPMDFVIWKPSTDEQPGWGSPWGRGRPGWHIECSAMARELLGEVFDIHAGGIDLQFPHHENEVAQSCCAHDTEVMANVWMHNEMIRVDGQKMAKSLGNFFTVKDLLERYNENFAIENIGPAIRLRMLQTRYREHLNWTDRGLEEASTKLAAWADLLWVSSTAKPSQNEARELLEESGFLNALKDDLNTSLAIAELDKLARLGSGPVAATGPTQFVDATPDLEIAIKARRTLFAALNLVGFDLNEILRLRHAEWSKRLEERANAQRPEIRDLIEKLVAQRADARKSKDFARADAIRDGFTAAGVVVKDTPDGAVWELTPDFDPSKLEALQ